MSEYKNKKLISARELDGFLKRIMGIFLQFYSRLKAQWNDLCL